MTHYLISYDLNSKGQEYEDLEEAISTTGESKKLLETTWLLNSTLTLDKLYNHLASIIDKNDDLLVIKVKEKEYFWLKKDSTAQKMSLDGKKIVGVNQPGFSEYIPEE